MNKFSDKHLSQHCPFTDGSAVYQARALLSRFDSTEYVNPCEYDNVSNARSMNQNSSETSLELIMLNTSVFPNPASDKLYVKSEAENSLLVIYNVIGQKVLEEKLSSENIINVEKLPNGTYLYKIVDASNNVIKKDKLIINK